MTTSQFRIPFEYSYERPKNSFTFTKLGNHKNEWINGTAEVKFMCGCYATVDFGGLSSKRNLNYVGEIKKLKLNVHCKDHLLLGNRENLQMLFKEGETSFYASFLKTLNNLPQEVPKVKTDDWITDKLVEHLTNM